jgi:hypothetical protein
MGPRFDGSALISGQSALATSCGLRAAGRRRWAVAIAISAIFHLVLGWSLFEAGIHWPMARDEPVDTRVPPPVDAVTVELSEPSPQAGPARPAVVPVAALALPQVHASAMQSKSVASMPLPDVEQRITAAVVPGVANGTAGGSRAVIQPRSRSAISPSLLGIEAAPETRKIVYVVDRSASMGPGGVLERATRAVGESIAALPADAQFQIVFYNRRPELLPADQGSWLWQASAQAKAAAGEWLHHLRAEGGTDHLCAIRAALSLRPDVIYWLTDGADLTTAEIESVTRSNKLKVAINTVSMGLGNRAESQPLQRVAVTNRGLFRQLSSTGE